MTSANPANTMPTKDAAIVKKSPAAACRWDSWPKWTMSAAPPAPRMMPETISGASKSRSLICPRACQKPKRRLRSPTLPPPPTASDCSDHLARRSLPRGCDIPDPFASSLFALIIPHLLIIHHPLADDVAECSHGSGNESPACMVGSQRALIQAAIIIPGSNDLLDILCLVII